MTPRDSHHFAQAINAMNSKRIVSTESALNVLAAVVLAILAAMALLHYLEPCEAAQLCTLAAVPTRSDNWLRRLLRPFRRWALRWRLADAEAVIEHIDADLAELPAVRLQLRREANALRARLAALQD